MAAYMSQPKTQLHTFKSWAGTTIIMSLCTFVLSLNFPGKSSDISYYLNSHHVDYHAWATQGLTRPMHVLYEQCLVSNWFHIYFLVVLRPQKALEWQPVIPLTSQKILRTQLPFLFNIKMYNQVHWGQGFSRHRGLRPNLMCIHNRGILLVK